MTKRASQEVEQKVNFGDDVGSTNESVCDVGVCDLREKTNTNNRCEKNLGMGQRHQVLKISILKQSKSVQFT